MSYSNVTDVWNELARNGYISQAQANEHIEKITNDKPDFDRTHLPTRVIHVRLKDLLVYTNEGLKWNENMFMALKILQGSGREIHVFSKREQGSNLGKLRGMLHDQGWKTSSIDGNFLRRLQNRREENKLAEAVFFTETDLREPQKRTIRAAHISIMPVIAAP